MFGIRGLLLGGVAFAAMTGFAVAADVPVRAPVYTKAPQAQAWSWEGQYIGVHGGYAWTDQLAIGSQFDPRGGYGGLQFGYLHHLSRNWFVGYEVDASFGNLQGAVIGGTTTEINAFGTARTRVGYAQGPLLLYVTGGLAWAQTELRGAGPVVLDSPHVGYAVGAGVEYAFAPNWSARIEYLYADLGTTRLTAGGSVLNDITMSTVRLGLNYRFANWNAAVQPAFPTKAPVVRTGWTGPYIGVHGGYGFGNWESNAPGLFAIDQNLRGAFAGIQSGYNWQLSQNWIFGLEGDSSWGSIKGSAGANSADIDAMGTVRARLGYTAGNMLTYATGGFAWMHADSISTAALSRDQYYLGWTIGAGVEYALSPRWSTKLEYLYSQYSLSDVIGGPNVTEDFSIHTVKVGLNYRAGILDFISGRW